MDEDNFIQEDEGSDDGDTVDDIISKLCEERKVVQEEQATLTALRSAGIHRPTTPGHKTSRSTNNTPTATPRLEERETFVSTNPSLAEGWEDQVVPNILNSYRELTARHHHEGSPIRIPQPNIAFNHPDNIALSPTNINEHLNNNNNFEDPTIETNSNVEINTETNITTPTIQETTHAIREEYKPTRHKHAKKNKHTLSVNPPNKSRSFTGRSTSDHFPSVKDNRIPSYSPKHSSSSNLSPSPSPHLSPASPLSTDMTSSLAKPRSKVFHVPLPFASPSFSDANSDLHTSLCKELDWFSPPADSPSPKSKTRPTSAPSSRKKNINVSPPRVTVISSPPSPTEESSYISSPIKTSPKVT